MRPRARTVCLLLTALLSAVPTLVAADASTPTPPVATLAAQTLLRAAEALASKGVSPAVVNAGLHSVGLRPDPGPQEGSASAGASVQATALQILEAANDFNRDGVRDVLDVRFRPG